MNRPSNQRARGRLAMLLVQLRELTQLDQEAPKFKRWHRDVRVALAYTFGPDSEAVSDFKSISFDPIMSIELDVDSETSREYLDPSGYVSGLEDAKVLLESMIEEIRYYWTGDEEAITQERLSATRLHSRKIFLVHGRDEGTMNEVARFAERMDLEPVVLSGNYYEAFDIVPAALLDRLRQGRVRVCNWHTLNWETDERLSRRRSVDKRGAKSDEAYVRDVLGEMARAKDILVLNDEAHHAWRVAGQGRTRGIARDEVETATKWIGGLDRIHRARGVLRCYDFSATPFAPTGGTSSEEALFDWIVSDFGLNDAIEAGLVKTPRVVVRDDALPDA